jgi:hypothetical protein
MKIKIFKFNSQNDFEEMKMKYDTLRAATEKLDKLNEQRVKELKVQLSKSQSEREKLTIDMNNMLKQSKNNADSETTSAAAASKHLPFNEETQALIFGLKNENADLKFKFKNITKQFENKCEELIQCEGELKKLKSLHDEQMRSDESQLKDLRSQLKGKQLFKLKVWWLKLIVSVEFCFPRAEQIK